METVVVGTTKEDNDSDKYEVLDRVLEDAGFWNTLRNAFRFGQNEKGFSRCCKT